MRRILITGGAGFLGSQFCDRLIRDGHEVICLDNLITGRMENVAHLIGHDGFRVIKQDVTEYLHIDGQLDYVLHFASPASPVDSQRFPIQALKEAPLGHIRRSAWPRRDSHGSRPWRLPKGWL
jgi:dTDP-glucose 4,6-dehydratase